MGNQATFLSDRKGLGKVSLLLIILAVASTAFSIGYWDGFLTSSGTQSRTEILGIANVTSVLSGNTLTLGFLVKNNGTADARLDYIVANDTVITTGVKDKIVPYDSQVAVTLQLSGSSFRQGSTVRMRLHTATGNDFTQLIMIPESDQSSLYTRLEKVEVSSVVVTKGTSSYSIAVYTKNTGSADATIDQIIINGKLLSQYSTPTLNSTLGSSGTLVAAGASATVTVGIGSQSVAPFTPGTTIELKLHTSAGKDYPQMVTLT